VRTDPVSKRARPCDLGHSHALELRAGSAAAEALTRAIASAGGKDADVLFVLKGRGAAGARGRELGQGVRAFAT